jgi:predicted DCC family thiol-disulfide oxidoreductase YuxK
MTMCDPSRPVLLIDGDCGFCQRVASWYRRHAPPSVQVVAYQDMDLTHGPVSLDDARAQVWWVNGGDVRGGARAISGALRTVGRLGVVAGWLIDAPGMRRVAAVVYRLVARYRYRLPGGTPACRTDSDVS